MSVQEPVHAVPSPVAFHLTTCDRVSPQSSLTGPDLDRLANKPVIFLFPSPTGVYCHAQLCMWVLGI